MAEQYVFLGEKFYRVEEEPNRTIGAAQQEVLPEQAVPSLIADWIVGKLYSVGSLDAGTKADATPVSDATFAAGVIAPVFDYVMEQNISFAEKQAKLYEILGDRPEVIRLFAEQFEPRWAEQIWGVKFVEALDPRAPAEVPVKAPANVMVDAARTQGTGPVSGGHMAGGRQGRSPSPGRGTSRGTGSPLRGAGGNKEAKAAGDPVVLFSGQFALDVTDLEVPGRGLHFRFARVYRHRTAYRGPLGYGWDHTWNLWLREASETEPGGRKVNVVYRATGRMSADRFTQTDAVGLIADASVALDVLPDASFSPPAGSFDTLIKEAGSYRLVMATGVSIFYRPDTLQASRIVDLNGNTFEIEYDADERLSQVIDPIGKEFRFSHDSVGRLVQVRDESGRRRLTFGYDSAGDLISAELIGDDGTVLETDYRYLGPDYPPELQHALVSVVNQGGGEVLEIEYGLDAAENGFARVVRQQSEGGAWSYQYAIVTDPSVAGFDPDADPLNYPWTSTTVTTPRGEHVEHWCNAQGNVVLRRERVEVLGRLTLLTSRYQYNDDGLVVREQTPDGSVTESSYGREEYIEAGGDPLTASPSDRRRFAELRRVVQRAAPETGVSRTIVEELKYGDWLRPLERRGPYWGRADGLPPGTLPPSTQFRYDPQWNLVEIVHPDYTDAGGMAKPGPRHTYGWTPEGMLREVSLGGVTTRYEYFPDALRSAYVASVIRDPYGLARRTMYEADAVGLVLSLQGEFGAREEYWFDGLGRRLQSTISAPGTSNGTTRWTFNRAGRLASCEESAGGPPSALPSPPIVRRWEHDAYGRIAAEVVGEGVEAARTSFVYGPDGELEKTVDPAGVTTRVEREVSGRVRRIDMALGTPETCSRGFQWTAAGRLARVIDSDGHISEFEYDAFGRLYARVDREGVRVEQTLDASGRPLREVTTSPHAGRSPDRWAEREWGYDVLGRMVVERVHVFDAPSAMTNRISTTLFYYDDAGRCTRIVEDGATTQLEWDGLGRRTLTIDPDGVQNRLSFDDAAALLVKETSAISSGASGIVLGVREEFRLDAFGHITRITDGVGNVRRTLFDTAGRAVVSVDPAGVAEEYSFDSRGTLNRLDTVAGATRSTLWIRQDQRGDTRRFDYSSGRSVTIERDALGRPVKISDDARTVEQTWDGNGLLSECRESGGLVVRYSYSPEGRLARVVADASGIAPGTPASVPVPACDYTWTPLGGLASATNRQHTVRFEYDSRGGLRMESVNGVLGQWTLRGQVRGEGSLESMTYSDGRRIMFRRSPAGRTLGCELAQVGTQGLGSSVAPASLITIDRCGNQAVDVRTPAAKVTIQYDGALRPVRAAWASSAGTAVRDERRVYGSRGECRLEQTDQFLREHTHDDELHLRAWREFDQSPVLPLSDVTARDARGHATAGQAASDGVRALPNPTVSRAVQFVLDADGARLRRTHSTAGTEMYVPDAGGRYTSIGGRVCAYGGGGELASVGSDRFEFDALRRLVAVVRNGQRAEISYDPLGRVIAIDEGAGANVLRRFGTDVCERLVGGTLEEQFLWDEGRLWSTFTPGAESTIVNALDGSPVARISSAGGLSARRSRDPFGARDPREPLTIAGFRGVPGVHGVWLMGARAYDPALGCFLQPDPWWPFADAHPYLYAQHSPVCVQDDWGLATGDIDWGIVARSAAVPLLAGITAGLALGFLIGAGLVSLPFVLLAGGILMAGMAFNSYIRRASEAMDAGMTDYQAQAALAAAGDLVGATDVYEGIRGRSALGDVALSTELRSQKLGSGGGTMAGFLFGGRSFSTGKSFGRQFALARAAKQVAALPQPGPHDLDWSSVAPLDANPPSPLKSAAAAADEATKSGLVDLNAGRVGVQTYNTSGTVVKTLNLVGTEGAHFVPQAAGKRIANAGLANYSPGRALVVQLPKGTHSRWDQGWIPTWNQAVANNQGVTVGELQAMVASALEQVPTNLLPAATKNTMLWRLQVELFEELGLTLNNVL